MAFLLRYVVIFGALALWVWCVFDVIKTQGEPRYLPKLVWLIGVVLFSPVGALAWLVLGRPQRIGARLIQPPPQSAPPPDDSPDFLRRVDEEIRRRRRVEELRRDGSKSPPLPKEPPAPKEPTDQDAVDREFKRIADELDGNEEKPDA